MHRIDGDRRQHGEDVLTEVIVERDAIRLGQLLGADQRDAHVAEPRAHRLVPDAVVLGDQLVRALADGLELLLRRHAVRRHFLDLTEHLRLQARGPHHEELVEVAREDAEELQPLVQRHVRVRGLAQHARVELQPGQLAIDVERRVAGARSRCAHRSGSGQIVRGNGILHRCLRRRARWCRPRGPRIVSGPRPVPTRSPAGHAKVTQPERGNPSNCQRAAQPPGWRKQPETSSAREPESCSRVCYPRHLAKRCPSRTNNEREQVDDRERQGSREARRHGCPHRVDAGLRPLPRSRLGGQLRGLPRYRARAAPGHAQRVPAHVRHGDLLRDGGVHRQQEEARSATTSSATRSTAARTRSSGSTSR